MASAGGGNSNGMVGAEKKEIIERLYKAVSEGDMEKVAASVVGGGDLEWWFHGPPQCHHMKKVLTAAAATGGGGGGGGEDGFRFEPRRVTGINEWVVIAEGWEGDAYWVHVWTLNKVGLITHFREYFNTWLTVRDTTTLPFLLSWHSQPRDLFRRSLPALLLTI